jgi:hypothetical protein
LGVNESRLKRGLDVKFAIISDAAVELEHSLLPIRERQLLFRAILGLLAGSHSKEVWDV